MINPELLEKIHIQDILEVCAYHGYEIMNDLKTNNNRKTVNKFKTDVGDSIYHVFITNQFTLDDCLIYILHLIFDLKSSPESKSVRLLMTHKKYNELCSIVKQLNISEKVDQLLKEKSDVVEKMDKDRMTNILSEAMVNYTPEHSQDQD